jgi:hypothetical protein
MTATDKEIFKSCRVLAQKTMNAYLQAEWVQPKAAVSRERQMEVYRDEVLREWFAEQGRGT